MFGANKAAKELEWLVRDLTNTFSGFEDRDRLVGVVMDSIINGFNADSKIEAQENVCCYFCSHYKYDINNTTHLCTAREDGVKYDIKINAKDIKEYNCKYFNPIPDEIIDDKQSNIIL